MAIPLTSVPRGLYKDQLAGLFELTSFSALTPKLCNPENPQNFPLYSIFFALVCFLNNIRVPTLPASECVTLKLSQNARASTPDTMKLSERENS